MAKTVKERFPQVNAVADALQSVRIDVKSDDRKKAAPQDFTECAFAKAACRTFNADGAFIGITTSYLIFGDKAVRFHTPESVAREVVTFDRHQDFSTGTYRLSPVSKCRRLGTARRRKSGEKAKRTKSIPLLMRHYTTRIRADD